MTSGAKVCDTVKDTFNEMKLKSKNKQERIRIVSLQIGNVIHLDQVYREADLEGKDVFGFLESLLQNDYKGVCRYFFYDCHFDTKESSGKEELVFMLWAPETAKIADRMIYSSSKSAILGATEGIKHNLQINGQDEFDRECFIDGLGKDVVSLEGRPWRDGQQNTQQHT